MAVVRKSEIGRPTKYSPKIVAKLKAAFANSFTVDQACLYAGVAKDTFYNWIDQKPDFSYQMTKAREQPTMKAKQVVVEAINSGDKQSAQWWLERRAPEEFGKANDGPPVTFNFHQHVHQQRERYHI